MVPETASSAECQVLVESASQKRHRVTVPIARIGFVKDCREMKDAPFGFFVYYRNRLIKPMWRTFNPTGSIGRGVVGVFEMPAVSDSRHATCPDEPTKKASTALPCAPAVCACSAPAV